MAKKKSPAGKKRTAARKSASVRAKSAGRGRAEIDGFRPPFAGKPPKKK